MNEDEPELAIGERVLVEMEVCQPHGDHMPSLWAVRADTGLATESFMSMIPIRNTAWTRHPEVTVQNDHYTYTFTSPAYIDRASALGNAANIAKSSWAGLVAPSAETLIRLAHYLVTGDIEESLADYSLDFDEDED